MRADFLQALQVLAQFTFHIIGQDLRVLAVNDVALAIEEPGGDFVLGWVVDYCDDSFEFFGGYFAGSVGCGEWVSVYTKCCWFGRLSWS